MIPRKVAKDLIGQFVHDIQRVELRLIKLENTKNLTFPRWAVDAIPEELVDGQLIVADDDQVYSFYRDSGLRNANT